MSIRKFPKTVRADLRVQFDALTSCQRQKLKKCKIIYATALNMQTGHFEKKLIKVVFSFFH